MSATEDSISDLMADYLRSRGINARTQISVSTPGTRSQPDFQVDNGGTFMGEAKWEDNKWEGFGEARDYGQLTGIAGSFLITYPNALRSEGAQARLTDDVAESVLSGHRFSCAFLRRDEPTDMVTLDLSEIPAWIQDHIQQRRLPEPDPDEVVSVLRQTAYTLNEELETAPEENLFRNVLGASPDEEEEREAARQTAGFLLVNQITFYRVLSSTGRFPEIDPNDLGSPSDLDEYFELVLDVDYTPVFGFKIAEDLPQESLTILKDAIKTIYAISPENIDHDVLGKVFHELIPPEPRKQIAAYYTMNRPAQLLADLAIESADDKVLDPACGSGTLLAASYLRKRELMDEEFTEDIHRRFVEEDITGIDVMPFAAHLSSIHLALQAPIYDTDEVNIGIEDSTKLTPGSKISPLSFVLPEADTQRGLGEYTTGQRPDVAAEQVETGSVAMDAAVGQEMELDSVDVVIMNPPFSRQESVAGFAPNYKNRLRDRFSRRDSRGQVHGKMGYYSYFLFLADKFLNEGGRIASVLPASVLTNSSDGGVREMLLDEYTIEYIISREDQPNFSEDTDRREILLVARKGSMEGEEAAYVTVESLDIDSGQVKELTTEAPLGEEVDVGSFRLRNASLEEFDIHNMFAPFSVHNPELLNLWDNVNAAEELVQVQNLDTGLIRGGSSHPWQDGAISDPSSHKQNDDLWTAVDVTEEWVIAQHRHTGDEIEIPRDNLHPYLLRYSYQDRIDVSDLDEFVIIDTGFDDYSRFRSLGGGDSIPQGWKDHVEGAASHACVQRRCDLTAIGTIHLSLFSSEPRTFHRMWCFSELNETEAKIFTSWLDSNFGLLQLIISRLPERGGWTNYRKFSVSRFSVINPSVLDEEAKAAILDAFDDVKSENFPSLYLKLSQLTPQDKLSQEDLVKLEDAFGEETVEKLGEGHAPSEKLDDVLLDTVGYTDGMKEEIKADLYANLLMELVELKEMMD